MCPLPHTAHYRSDVTEATLTTKEASILKSIRTIHRLPSQQTAHPTRALFPHQDRPWSRPQQIPPYQHPQLPSKRLSLILSPLIYQIQSPSPHSAHMYVRSYGTDGTQTLLPSSGKRAPPYGYKTRHLGTLDTTSTSAIL